MMDEPAASAPESLRRLVQREVARFLADEHYRSPLAGLTLFESAKKHALPKPDGEFSPGIAIEEKRKRS